MRDIFFAVLALACVGVFLGILIWRVPEVALIVVFTVVFAMVVYDFWLELKHRREENGG
ncbi:MAG TPA: hypothetical protein VHG92_07460 [Afifellaceae bacterium]|nr:hypothetical protein [Afifellaceae bacterium]